LTATAAAMAAAARALRVALAAAALVAALAPTARAETLRFAIVVGANQGDAGHPPLRYAEHDAAKMAAVLTELGGFGAADLLLLRGPNAAALRAALDEAGRRVAAWHAEHRGQAVVLFYFSGHSDGRVLELADEGFPFPELRQRLSAGGADVRLMIVDSCRSGALLALKGGTLGQPFDIHLADDLGSTGEALIASSAADEAALESSEIGASYFSHHFVSGLRGAADVSGDGLVTLAEAYQYAFARTLRATSDTVVGPQHPAYDYRLAGHGDLVLTELRHPSAALSLPAGFDRLLLVATARQQVIAEIGPRSVHRIAVLPGAYELHAWRDGQTLLARIQLGAGQDLRVDAAALRPVSGAAVTAKGRDGDRRGDGDEGVAVASRAIAPAPREDAEDHRRPWAVGVAAGVVDGVADRARLTSARVAVETATQSAWCGAVAVEAGSGRTTGMREDRLGVEALASRWIGRATVRAGLGLAMGAGVAIEHVDSNDVHWSGLAWVGPAALVEASVDARTTLRAAAQVPVTVLRRDDRLVLAALPGLWLGVARSF
jgi:hypothetical protein